MAWIDTVQVARLELLPGVTPEEVPLCDMCEEAQAELYVNRDMLYCQQCWDIEVEHRGDHGF